MPLQLLSTKLSIPPLRSKIIARPRLIEQLNQGLECGFVLVSAPAGYGKTTLLTAWLDQVDFTTTWLSLDEGDNDPARFLAYLAAALRGIDLSIGKNFEIPPKASPLPAIETLLTPLVNDIAQLGEPFCLVLDDYHVIQNQTIHQMIAFLLEHRLQSMHLAIATRADPPLALARMRARSEMLEQRQADLLFTEQEASDFLSHTMGLKISPGDVARISRRIEGWIAGLQMAALGLSGGQQQRLVIARAIAIEPEELLLDEPASALDPISTLKIEELIYELKDRYTIVIVTHNMQQAARVSDYTAFMFMGELVEFGATNALFTNPRKKQTEDYITGRYG